MESHDHSAHDHAAHDHAAHDHPAHDHSAGGADAAAMTELLDLDAEVLHSYYSELTGWVRELAADLIPHRVLDLGCGTGTGTFALFERFEQADAVAVDVSQQLLDRLSEKAHVLGMTDRVHTVQADLDTAWPDIGVFDLAWASSSLHHMADPHRVLIEIFDALKPGALLIVAEMNSFPRFLPDDMGLGRPGLEARCHAAVSEAVAAQLPHLGSDWGFHLSDAGFTVHAERTFTIDLEPPLPAPTGRYVAASLRLVRSHLDGRLSAEDLGTLDILIDSEGPDGVLQRDDLSVRTQRTVWVGRRP
jgi:SAM-dependent methyltransferase